jgi:hypothetical protein
VIFRAVAEGGLEIYEKEGFEVSVDHGASWTAVMVTAVTGDTVTLAVPNASRITSVRYLWSGVPCTHPHFSVSKCSVYSGGLPATPFIANVTDMYPKERRMTVCAGAPLTTCNQQIGNNVVGDWRPSGGGGERVIWDRGVCRPPALQGTPVL